VRDSGLPSPAQFAGEGPGVRGPAKRALSSFEVAVN
jgi:hypothetical protein